MMHTCFTSFLPLAGGGLCSLPCGPILSVSGRQSSSGPGECGGMTTHVVCVYIVFMSACTGLSLFVYCSVFWQPVVVQTSADFGGVERLVVDELLTQQQCSDLIHLASVSMCKCVSKNLATLCEWNGSGYISQTVNYYCNKMKLAVLLQNPLNWAYSFHSSLARNTLCSHHHHSSNWSNLCLVCCKSMMMDSYMPQLWQSRSFQIECTYKPNSRALARKFCILCSEICTRKLQD